MSDLRKQDSREMTLEERLRRSLRTKFGRGTPDSSALMLDVSGSMDDALGAGRTKIGELRILVDKFPGTRRFEFSSSAQELMAKDRISDPHGGTAMHLGFSLARSSRVEHLVLITDGEPDNEAEALREAQGLRIDVFYVGPDGNTRAQEFLAKLGKATGGSYGKASLEFTRALEERVRLCLPAAGGAKGPIAL